MGLLRRIGSLIGKTVQRVGQVGATAVKHVANFAAGVNKLSGGHLGMAAASLVVNHALPAAYQKLAPTLPSINKYDGYTGGHLTMAAAHVARAVVKH